MDIELLKLQFELIYGRLFNPLIGESENWLKWVTVISSTTCANCFKRNGTIFSMDEAVENKPPLHEKCKCHITKVESIVAGTATIDGLSGADYSVKNYGKLPKGYVTKEQAMEKGWKPMIGNLRNILNNSTIGGGIYGNREKKLPNKRGRIWYEADINYLGGYRNNHRLVYSNDGLLFVTYNHYMTFYEIV